MRRIQWNRMGLLIFVAALLLSGCHRDAGTAEFSEVYTEEADLASEAEEEPAGDAPSTEAETGVIYVHVCGQVVSPGVYELKAGARLYEAVEAAGGLTAEANEAAINQAQLLEDAQQVYVPSQAEADVSIGAPETGTAAAAASDGKVDLNRATKEELMSLSGIGEVKAEAIIRYREENGAFGSIEEIMEIDGIKDGVFQKVKDDIKV